LLAGLLVYELVHVIAARITARTGGQGRGGGVARHARRRAPVAMMFGIASS